MALWSLGKVFVIGEAFSVIQGIQGIANEVEYAGILAYAKAVAKMVGQASGLTAEPGIRGERGTFSALMEDVPPSRFEYQVE
jgi:hypothetical protein